MDNLDPKGQSRSNWKWFKMLNNNRGEVGGEGGGDGEGEGGEGEGEGGGVGVAPNWRDGLDADIKEHPAIATFKTPADLAKSYVNAQKLIGAEKIPMPPKDAALDSQEYQAVFDRLGRPSDPKNYTVPEIPNPTNAPVATEEQMTEFKNVAHSIGLLPAQAEALIKFNQEGAINQHNQATASATEQYEKAETQLRKELGKSYDGQVQKAQGLINKFGDEEVNNKIGASGLGRDPAFIKFLMNIAKNFGEGGELLGEPVQPHILSPEQAMKDINKIKGDKTHPFHKKDHAEHADAMKQMTHLFQMAYPDNNK